MKTRFLFLIFISITLIGTLNSCDKHRAKKLSGTYSCKVDYHYMDITPSNFDTTYFEDLEIKQDGKKLIILGYSIHVDSLRQEKEYYEGYVHDYITVQFKKDHVYINRVRGGLGGSAGYYYEGTKSK